MLQLTVPVNSKTNIQQQQKNTLNVYSCFQYCHKAMIQKYNSQRQCLHLEIIQNILNIEQQGNKNQFKIPTKQTNRILDFNFNDQFQYMTKYYDSSDTIIEMAEMCEYYKYYMQDPLIVYAEHFKILYCYSEKKKEIAYKKIKKLLNYSERGSTKKNQKSDTKKTKELIKLSGYQNFLKDISICYNQSSKDQSKLFSILRQKLVKKYGNSTQNTMKQVDKLYKFDKKIDNSQLTILRKPLKNNATKIDHKINAKKQLLKNIMMQSTNNSTLQFQSNFNFSKSLIQNDFEGKNLDQVKKKNDKKIVEKTLSNKKHLNPCRSSCQFSGRIYTHMSKQQIQKKRKLRKRSCQNFQVKKIKTIANQNLNQGLQLFRKSEFLPEPSLAIIQQNRGTKQKNKQAFSRRNQINSSSTIASAKKFDSKYLFTQKQIPVFKKHSPISHTASNENDIKNTIQKFRTKIRQQIRQFTEDQDSSYIRRQLKQINKFVNRENTQKSKSIKKSKNSPSKIVICTKKPKK